MNATKPIREPSVSLESSIQALGRLSPENLNLVASLVGQMADEDNDYRYTWYRGGTTSRES